MKFLTWFFVFVFVFFSATPARGGEAVSLEAQLREAEARVAELTRLAGSAASLYWALIAQKETAEFQATTLRWRLHSPSSIELEPGSPIVRMNYRAARPEFIQLSSPLEITARGRAIISLGDFRQLAAALHGRVEVSPPRGGDLFHHMTISRPGLRPFENGYAFGGYESPWGPVFSLRTLVEEGLRLPIEWNGVTRTIRITSLPPGCAPDGCG